MNYMVAICDILGFSELVENNPLDRVVHSSLEWLSRSLQHSMQKESFPDSTPSMHQLQKHSQVGLAWFSDTILIYTLEDTDACVNVLASTLGWLLFETMLTSDVRLRCGISYGEAHIDSGNGVYVGKPLIEAYQLEKSQAWSGGALTPTAVHRLPPEGRTGQFAYNWFLIPYKVPLKAGKELETLAVDWTVGMHYTGDFSFAWSRANEDPTAEDWRNRPDVCRKWHNTKSFHDSVCRYCRPAQDTADVRD